MINKLIFKLTQRFPFLSKIWYSHDGYREEPLRDTDYIFGASPLIKSILREDGQWDDYLPEEEVQQGRLIETMACVTFSFLNTLEILAKRLWISIWNKSDRYTAKMSGTSSNGNSMNNVAESGRKTHGIVNEETYPWNRDTFNWSEFYKTVPKDVLTCGQNFLKDYKIGYEAIQSHQNAIIEALKFSPVWCAGFAWYKIGDKYYSYGNANHAFLIYGYEKGSHWKAFDSYAPFKKKLDWNFKITYPKIVTLQKMKEEWNQVEINKWIARGFRFIQRPQANGEFYRLTDDGLVFLEKENLKEELKKHIPDNDVITWLSRQNLLVGLPEEYYYRLKK